jgi:hypothetical protein
MPRARTDSDDVTGPEEVVETSVVVEQLDGSLLDDHEVGLSFLSGVVENLLGLVEADPSSHGEADERILFHPLERGMATEKIGHPVADARRLQARVPPGWTARPMPASATFMGGTLSRPPARGHLRGPFMDSALHPGRTRTQRGLIPAQSSSIPIGQ